MSDHTPTIDEILARVRAETTSVAAVEASPIGRRQGLGTIPLVSEPDDGEKIPLGRPVYSIEEFSALDDEDFLRNAYRVLLGRNIDVEGRSHFLPALREGNISYIRVLDILSRSDEGKAQGVKIRWLAPAAALDRLSKLPIAGKILEPFMRFLVRSTTSRRLSLLAERHTALIHEINTALSSVRKNQALLDAGHMEVEKRTSVTEHRAAEARADAETSKDKANASLSEIRSIRQEIVAQRNALDSLIAEARSKLPAEHQQAVRDLEEVSLDSLYVAFENRFRGSTSEILHRSERYLPIFTENKPIAAGGVVLDIGCGRGEFLFLLKRHNIVTRGIDLNSAMVQEAKALDLDVLEGDAIAYLRSLPDNSLAAITGFHIVEHISFKELVSLFDTANRVLMPGGLVLFETPNPENLVVGACTFNYDPTHNKPLPPDYLRFIAEARGFTNARIVRKDEDCDLSQQESGFEPREVNDWFRQPADYALYAEKPVTASQGGEN